MSTIEQDLETLVTAAARLRTEIGRRIVGQVDVVEEVVLCLFAGGHVLLEGRIDRRTEDVSLKPACDAATFIAVQQSLEDIHIDRRLLEYCVALVRTTRSEAQLQVGCSPRGTLALVKLTRAAALLDGRAYVGPDDIRTMAVPALAHRVVLSDDAWARGVNPADVVRRAMDRVPVPQGT